VTIGDAQNAIEWEGSYGFHRMHKGLEFNVAQVTTWIVSPINMDSNDPVPSQK
jgi:hypothetical protein